MQRLRQRGVATVLMALLVGMAVVASTFAVMQYVRTSQDQSLTVHAQTQAQMNAWTAAELVRQYLAGLTSTQRATLLASVQAGSATGTALTFSTGADTMGARLMNTSTATNFVAQVTGTTASTIDRAMATATLQVNYTVIPGTTAIAPTGVFSTGKGLNFQLAGNVQVTTPNNDAVYNIGGDVFAPNYQQTGIKTINALGTINIAGGGSFTTLNSNCDVNLSGGAYATTINALRNICFGSTSSSHVTGVATANGAIQVGTANNNELRARSDDVSGLTSAPHNCQSTGFAGNSSTGLAATCETPDYIGVELSKNYARVNTVLSLTNVYLKGTIVSLTAGGNLVAVNGGGSVTRGTVGGDNGGFVTVTSVNGTKPTIPEVSAVVQSSETPFNAWQFGTLANYSFYYASTVIRVKVVSVNGIPDGDYRVDNGTTIRLPGSDVNLCTDNSACISRSTASGGSGSTSDKWLVNTNGSLLRGVVWFNGDLNIHNGTYYNTFVATGSITSQNANATIYAPNWSPSTKMCSGVTNYPTNFCGVNNNMYNNNAAAGVGSYVFAAGSYGNGSITANGNSAGTITVGTYDPDNYVGGNITMAGSINLYGNILAGHAFSTGTGNGTIHGSINSQGSGLSTDSQTNTFATHGSSMPIDLTGVPSTMNNSGLNLDSSSSSTLVEMSSARYL